MSGTPHSVPSSAAPGATSVEPPPLRWLTIDDFLRRVGSKTPAPGGGAVACSTGATAAALAKMVVEYSLGKKNLAEHQQALQRAGMMLGRLVDLFMQLADEDAAAYGLVNELSKLPETDERRQREYAGAAAAAVQAPRAALAACADLLTLIESLVTITNRHLRSDLAIAGVLAEAGAKSAWWNVSVNLSLIDDTHRRADVEAECRGEVERAMHQRVLIERGCE
jgi:formiminotetrahydrofolate cyclodeaminase